MKYFHLFLRILLVSISIIAFSLLYCLKGHAQERNIVINATSSNQIVFEPNEKTTKINLLFFSTTKQVSTIQYSLSAPNKSVVSIKSLGVSTNATTEQALSLSKAFYPLNLAVYGGKFSKSLSVSTTSNGSSINNTSDLLTCNGYLPIEAKDYFTGSFRESFGRDPYSDTELCNWLFGSDWILTNGGGTSSTGLGYLQGVSHILKDLCDTSKKYFVQFSIDLSKISEQDRAAGFTMTLDLTETVYKAGMQASLKPMGDGKFRETLIMMASLGYDENHLYTRWGKGSTKKLLKSTIKSIVKIAPYRSLLLGISLPREQLTGGKMTVITFTNTSAYGVCFSATKTRQKLNGYP